MEITNINTNSNKNLQLVSTFGEKNQHSYIDLLEFKYNIDGEIYTIRDIFRELFTLKEENKKLKEELSKQLTLINKVQNLITTSIDLLDARTLKALNEIEEIREIIKILK